GEVVAIGGVPAEEAAVDRLHDVFGIDLGPQKMIEPRAGQGNEPVSEAMKYLRRRVAVAGAQAIHHVGEGMVHAVSFTWPAALPPAKAPRPRRNQAGGRPRPGTEIGGAR